MDKAKEERGEREDNRMRLGRDEADIRKYGDFRASSRTWYKQRSPAKVTRVMVEVGSRQKKRRGIEVQAAPYYASSRRGKATSYVLKK